jgi:UDP-N-acetylmuramate--alanine ligase
MNDKKKNKYHFIGIGGAGMSAIAGVLLDMGHEISGSDIKESRFTKSLAKKGARICIGHSENNLGDSGTVVYSSAIREDNMEFVAAKKLNFEIKKRAETLAQIGNLMKFICVAGTHGKTTTTSMISFILEHSGKDPTYLIGAELNEIGSNSRYGKGGICVAEADESDGSLIYMKPLIAVVTNVEADHLENHGSLEALEKLFKDFMRPVPKNIICGDSANLRKIAKELPSKNIFYGLNPDNEVTARSISFKDTNTSYSLVINGKEAGKVKLKVPGLHNVLNSLAAITVAIETGVELDKIINALSKFKGVKRRFEIIGKVDGITVVDDYAHHPTEVKATLMAAKNGAWKRIIAVFQPHRYSRTMHLHKEFADAFNDANLTVLTDVYGAGEQPIPGITGKLIADSVLNANPKKEVAYLPHKSEIVNYLKTKLSKDDLVLIMGAGDISTVGNEIISVHSL